MQYRLYKTGVKVWWKGKQHKNAAETLYNLIIVQDGLYCPVKPSGRSSRVSWLPDENPRTFLNFKGSFIIEHKHLFSSIIFADNTLSAKSEQNHKYHSKYSSEGRYLLQMNWWLRFIRQLPRKWLPIERDYSKEIVENQVSRKPRVRGPMINYKAIGYTGESLPNISSLTISWYGMLI